MATSENAPSLLELEQRRRQLEDQRNKLRREIGERQAKGERDHRNTISVIRGNPYDGFERVELTSGVTQNINHAWEKLLSVNREMEALEAPLHEARAADRRARRQDALLPGGGHGEAIAAYVIEEARRLEPLASFCTARRALRELSLPCEVPVAARAAFGELLELAVEAVLHGFIEPKQLPVAVRDEVEAWDQGAKNWYWQVRQPRRREP